MQNRIRLSDGRAPDIAVHRAGRMGNGKLRFQRPGGRRQVEFPRHVSRQVVLATCVLTILVPRWGWAHDIAGEMRTAAERFLTSLSDEQRNEVVIPVDSQRRTAWHYIPSSMMSEQGGRRGLEIKRMTPQQRVLAVALLNSALSHRGNLQAMTIMALESILRELESGNPARDPEMYHVAIHGRPDPQHTWGWSVEGHHLSVNVTLADGEHFSVTPSFWGSNPAVVKSGPFQGLETLADEQNLGRAFVQSLSPEQRNKAIIASTAPSEIVTGAQRQVERQQFDPPQGIAFDDLDAQQQMRLLNLASQFTTKYRSEIIEQISHRSPIEGKGMYFAWAGSTEPGQGHYYRIQTPHFLFEYDNTQNDANHVHTVWRAFDGDFGEDLLRKHYEESPHHK